MSGQAPAPEAVPALTLLLRSRRSRKRPLPLESGGAGEESALPPLPPRLHLLRRPGARGGGQGSGGGGGGGGGGG